MAPILARKNGKPYMSVGSPGGRKVNNANTNLSMNILEFGMGPQEAITTSRSDSSGHTTLVDQRISLETVKTLKEICLLYTSPSPRDS